MDVDYLYKVIGMLYVEVSKASGIIQSLQKENDEQKTQIEKLKIDVDNGRMNITKVLKDMQENARKSTVVEQAPPVGE